MHRLPQCHLGNPRVDCRNIHQVNQYNTPLSPGYSYARHTSSVLKSNKVFNPIKVKPQRQKFNSSQQDREGETPYDPTILTKLVARQDQERERERERDQTHIY